MRAYNELDLNVKMIKDRIEISVEVPGLNRDDIDIMVFGNLFRIVAKYPEFTDNDRFLLKEIRRNGTVEREFRLDQPVDTGKISAELKGDGILRITLPLTREEKKIINIREV